MFSFIFSPVFVVVVVVLPIPRRATDVSAKNVSMVSGFYGAPKRLMLQTRLESVEEESLSGGSVSGRRRKKEVKESAGVQDARTEGFKTGQQQKTHCPKFYTQPHPSFRPQPGPFLLSSHSPPPGSLHFPLWNKWAHAVFWSGKERQVTDTCSVQ